MVCICKLSLSKLYFYFLLLPRCSHHLSTCPMDSGLRQKKSKPQIKPLVRFWLINFFFLLGIRRGYRISWTNKAIQWVMVPEFFFFFSFNSHQYIQSNLQPISALKRLTGVRKKIDFYMKRAAYFIFRLIYVFAKLFFKLQKCKYCKIIMILSNSFNLTIVMVKTSSPPIISL